MLTGAFQIGEFKVHAVNRTKTEWEWAEEIADHLIHVGDNAPAPVRDQARAFRERMVQVIAINLRTAVQHERIACAALAENGGAPSIGQAIRARTY